MSDENKSDRQWHLSKTIPVGIILALFFQFFGGVVIVSRMDERVRVLEERMVDFAEVVRAMDAEADRAAEKLSAIEAILLRIERHMDTNRREDLQFREQFGGR